MRASFFCSLGLVIMIFGISGCSIISPDFATVTYYDYGSGILERRPLDSYPVKLLVTDLRPQIVALQKLPQFVGMAENGLGEPRAVLNRDGCPVPVGVHQTPHCLSFAESVRHQLKNEKTFPPDAMAKGLVMIEILQWQTQAGQDLRLDYALNVSLRSANGEALGKASIQGLGEVIDTQNVGPMSWANHEAKEHLLSLVVSGVLRQKLDHLLKALNPAMLASLR